MPSNRRGSLADTLLAALPESPDAFPQKIDLVGMTTLVIQLDASAYRAASFLDDRLLRPGMTGAWLPMDQVAQISLAVTRARPTHFIFHTGHVGSTLVSRLLDETDAVLSLREPLPLRTLADAHDVLAQPESLLSQLQFDLVLDTFLRLWGRGYVTTQSVVVKTTSSASRLAIPILARAQRSRAIYMNVRAEPYLATLLAGENSSIDLRGHGPGRMQRLQSRIAVPLSPLHSLSTGELAAMSWLAESWTQQEVLKRFASTVLALDFDRFLSSVEDGLARVVSHLQLPDDPGCVARLARGSALTRYSKAPEYAYTPDTRAGILRDSRRRNREEIRKGLTWLEGLARSEAAVAEIVDYLPGRGL